MISDAPDSARSAVILGKGHREGNAILALKGVKRLVKGKLGKSYYCDTCGQEVKVTKEGGGVLVCCGKPMREL